jgi:hypothetical protein
MLRLARHAGRSELGGFPRGTVSGATPASSKVAHFISIPTFLRENLLAVAPESLDPDRSVGNGATEIPYSPTSCIQHHHALHLTKTIHCPIRYWFRGTSRGLGMLHRFRVSAIGPVVLQEGSAWHRLGCHACELEACTLVNALSPFSVSLREPWHPRRCHGDTFWPRQMP